MSLTELSYYTRRFMPFIIIFLLVFLVGFYAFKLILLTAQIQSSKNASLVNPVFGKVKAITLTNAKPSQSLNFTLDTIEGQPVTATDSAKVYLLPPTSTRFGYRDRIYLMAKTLGFDTSVIKHILRDKTATFEDDKQKLDIDVTNYNFKYQYDLQKDSTPIRNITVPQQTEAEGKAMDFLRTFGRYPDELLKGTRNTIYLTYTADASSSATTTTATNSATLTPGPGGPNMVEVDFFRPDIDKYPIVSPKYFNSPNYVVMIFNETGFKVIRAQIAFFEKSEEQVGVYPVKTGVVAWDELKAGKGWVVSGADNPNVTVKKMFIGYYDPDIYQPYLQPVYVFIGDNNFVGYVPAVDAIYTQ